MVFFNSISFFILSLAAATANTSAWYSLDLSLAPVLNQMNLSLTESKSESLLLARNPYTYEEYDSWFHIALIVHRYKHAYKDNKLDQVNNNIL